MLAAATSLNAYRWRAVSVIAVILPCRSQVIFAHLRGERVAVVGAWFTLAGANAGHLLQNLGLPGRVFFAQQRMRGFVRPAGAGKELSQRLVGDLRSGAGVAPRRFGTGQALQVAGAESAVAAGNDADGVEGGLVEGAAGVGSLVVVEAGHLRPIRTGDDGFGERGLAEQGQVVPLDVVEQLVETRAV